MAIIYSHLEEDSIINLYGFDTWCECELICDEENVDFFDLTNEERQRVLDSARMTIEGFI